MQKNSPKMEIFLSLYLTLADEATAFADPENELLIQKAFEKLTEGKTVLLIAHRLSTVQNSSEILVLKEGCVTERGTHGQLLKQKGLYASMWQDYLTAASWKVGDVDAKERAVTV